MEYKTFLSGGSLNARNALIPFPAFGIALFLYSGKFCFPA